MICFVRKTLNSKTFINKEYLQFSKNSIKNSQDKRKNKTLLFNIIIRYDIEWMCTHALHNEEQS